MPDYRLEVFFLYFNFGNVHLGRDKVSKYLSLPTWNID